MQQAMVIPPRFQWLAALADDCPLVTIEPAPANFSPLGLLPSYPGDFTAFLQAFNGADLDGWRILSCQELLDLRNEDAVAADIPADFLPFVRDTGSADFFCFTSDGQVCRWFHDGGAGKLLYPDYYAFLLTRAMYVTGVLEAFERPGLVNEKEAGQKASYWEEKLRQKLIAAGANMEDPWHPAWENWKGADLSP